ncbi:MAG: GNAT family N-acetyltransferase [Desulfobacula sp.]|nr:GNAT family N-acetyltransferase [Desulfobacula sp.]
MSDMLVKLYDLPEAAPFIKKLKVQGIIIRTAMPHEKNDVVEWTKETFGSGWAGECDVAFSNHPVSCFIAVQKGKIIGFACYDSTCRNFFGPTGVIEIKQGLGIGKALFLSCLHTMAVNGYAYAIIGGVKSMDFYARTAGATIIEGSSPGIYRDPLAQKKN